MIAPPMTAIASMLARVTGAKPAPVTTSRQRDAVALHAIRLCGLEEIVRLGGLELIERPAVIAYRGRIGSGDSSLAELLRGERTLQSKLRLGAAERFFHSLCRDRHTILPRRRISACDFSSDRSCPRPARKDSRLYLPSTSDPLPRFLIIE